MDHFDERIRASVFSHRDQIAVPSWHFVPGYHLDNIALKKYPDF